MNRTFLRISLGFIAVLVAGCSEHDPAAPSAPRFANLEQRDDVIVNLAAAHTDQNFVELERLLAAGFRFFFSPEDVRLGNVEIESWDRASELKRLSKMLVGGRPDLKAAAGTSSRAIPTWGEFKEWYKDGLPWPGAIVELEMNLALYQDDATWHPYPPEGSGRFYKDVRHHFKILGERAEHPFDIGGASRFVVEQNDIDGKPTWQLVEWHDDFDSQYANE